MSVDCNLYLNPKWNEMEIKDVVERVFKQKVEWKPTNHAGYNTLILKDGYISCFWHCATPIGNFTCLMAGERRTDLFKQIADALGGLLMRSDYDSKLEFISGKASEENALPFFIRHAITHDGIDPQDLPALIASIKKWEKEVAKADIKLS